MADTIEKWGVFEAWFNGPDKGNPFRDTELSATFTKGSRTVTVTGFYDGEGAYKVRFMPDTEGRWSYRTHSATSALDGQEGFFDCVAPSAGNHGPVKVEKYHHFRYADGTFYRCLGTTCYAWIHQGDALARQTLDSLKASPFNKMRMTVFPKSYIYNEYNEPENYVFPLIKKGVGSWDGRWDSRGGKIEWEFDFSRFDLAFFNNGAKWFDHRRSWITHCSIQLGEFKVRQWREEYRKPIVIDEMCYEGNIPMGWGNINAMEMVHRFWDIALSGGYPGHSEVYLNPQHIMWWNKGGTLRGESPERIRFLRKIMELGPDMGIEPHPERMSGLYCGFKTDDWIVGYTGIRQPVEIPAKLPAGKRYSLSYIDVWGMTVTKTTDIITAAQDETRIPLTGKPYAAFLLEASRQG